MTRKTERPLHCDVLFFVGKWKAFIMATNQLPAQQCALLTDQAALPNNIAFPSISSKRLLQCIEQVRNHTGNLPAGRTILAGAPQKLLAQKHWPQLHLQHHRNRKGQHISNWNRSVSEDLDSIWKKNKASTQPSRKSPAIFCSLRTYKV